MRTNRLKGYRLMMLVGSLASATWLNTAYSADCTYVVSNDWGSGFTAAIEIANNGSTAINGWNLSWEYTDGTVLTNTWNATVTGNNPYTATALSWNTTINPGQTVSIGIQGQNGAGAAQIPAVNGSVCDSSDTGSTTSGDNGTDTSTGGNTNTDSTSGTESCVSGCDWYGSLYPICSNQSDGWGWEDYSCIGVNTCNSQQGGGGVVECSSEPGDTDTGDSNTDNSNSDTSDNSSTDTTEDVSALYVLSGSILDTDDTSKMCTKRDMRQTADTSEAETLQLYSGQDVTISEEGVYVLSGSVTNTTVIVDADSEAKVQLVLNGVSITNQDAPGVYVKSADKVFVTTTASNNRMEVSGTYLPDGDTNLDAVIFSKDDLVLNGTGSLHIVSMQGNGVTSKDDLKVTGGSITVTAPADGLEANDSIRICGGDITVNSGKDALHSENDEDDSVGYIYIADGTLNISAGDDGVRATSVTQIDGGTINVQQSVEGIEGTYVQINNGTINVYATDDGINATRKSTAYNVVIEVNGGNISVEVQGNDVDGFDSNGDIYINGGTIAVTCPTQGMSGAFDADGAAVLNGGAVTVNGSVVTELTGGMGGGWPGFQG